MDAHDAFEYRLFLEELCCNVCRFRHAAQNDIGPERVAVDQEVCLGSLSAFADLRVRVPGKKPFFIEIKIGYSREQLLESVTRKYGPKASEIALQGEKVVIVVGERASYEKDLEAEIRRHLHDQLQFEIWDKDRLFAMASEIFQMDPDELKRGNIHEVKSALDRAQRVKAFGTCDKLEALHHALLWHFDFWHLHQLTARGKSAEQILPPMPYQDVVVLLADLCGFSGYVKDTPNERVARESLTSYYAKTRYQVINSGGMMYQFVGDAVIGLFGLLQSNGDPVSNAMKCAAALLEIGDSVSYEWQRQIDRVQRSQGVHIGMAVGELQVVSLRPFGRARIGVIGDVVNVASRLDAVARAGEIVVSNTLYQRMDQSWRSQFTRIDSVDAKNVGNIQAWKRTSKLHPNDAAI